MHLIRGVLIQANDPVILHPSQKLLHLFLNASLFSLLIFHDSIEIYNISMKFIQKFKNLIYQFDLFCSSQLLRYN